MTEARATSLEDLVAGLGGAGLGRVDAAGPDQRGGGPGDGHRPAGSGHQDPGHGAGTGTTSVRTVVVDGHDVRIETTYRVTVDGQPFEGHLEVLDDGRVHYHGLPNYAVESALDLMRLVVEHFGTTPPAEDELAEETS